MDSGCLLLLRKMSTRPNHTAQSTTARCAARGVRPQTLGLGAMKHARNILFASLVTCGLNAQAMDPAFFLVSTSNDNTSRGMAVLCLSNSTGRVMGFVANSLGSREPFYSLQAKSTNGWVALPLGWCGTEAHPVSLQPSDAVIICAPSMTNVPWRVGIWYWSGSMTNQVWSETIDFKPNQSIERTVVPR